MGLRLIPRLTCIIYWLVCLLALLQSTLLKGVKPHHVHRSSSNPPFAARPAGRTSVICPQPPLFPVVYPSLRFVTALHRLSCL